MDKYAAKYHVFKREDMNFIHLNAQSLLPKIWEVRIIAQKTNASFIGICETWLDSSMKDSYVQIEGYTMIRKDREGKRGGGVCMYISDKIPAFTQLKSISNSTESVWVKVYLPETEPFIVGTVYRPPDDKMFLYNFKVCLKCLDSFSYKDCIILGDFNICLQNKENSLCIEYETNFSSFGLQQLISSPTRISNTSSTLIDHILVKDATKIDKVGTINMALSDHNMIYCTRKISTGQMREETVGIRDMENIDFKLLNKEVQKVQWTTFTESDSVAKNWDRFSGEFLNIINRVAPVRSQQVIDPWMINDGILNELDKRDRLFDDFVKSRTKKDWKEVSRIKSKIGEMTKNARSDYISKKFEKIQDNSKELNKELKELGFLTQRKVEPKKAMYLNDRICFHDKNIANHFNTHFITVASKLVSNLPTVESEGTYHVMSDSFSNFYSKNNTLNNLSQVQEDFVFKEFCAVYMKKGTCLDKIPPELKSVANELKYPITSIINQAMKSGFVPESMKQTKINPRLKEGVLSQEHGALEVTNYIPMFMDTQNIDILSKILEKLVVCQLKNFLRTSNNNTIRKHQSRFRRFSTDTCLINLLERIWNKSSKNLFTGMLILNLQQAYNILDHEILRKKLNKMGIHDPWFELFLTERTQVVECEGVLSDSKNITCGLPKGNKLGHILFSYFVNDLPTCIDKNCKLILYEEKIAILYSHKDTNEISKKLSKQFDQCSEWLKENKLVLGEKKCILFGPWLKLKGKDQFEVKCQNNDIKAEDHVKYLGITLDKFLEFDLLIEEIEANVDSKLMFLERNGKELIKTLRIKLASALILPCFDRCLAAWYESLSEALKEKLQEIQDKVIRFMNNSKSNVNINCRILKSIKALRVADQVQQLRLEYAHDTIYGIVPKYPQEHFYISENNGEWPSNPILPVPPVGAFQKGNFYYCAILDWNSLPLEIRLIVNKANFISKVKLHLEKKAKKREKSKSK